MYSWLVCAGLCTKQWKNSGYLTVTFAGSSLWATIPILCLAPCSGGQLCQQCPPVPSPPVFQRPWQDTRGQKEREVCVFRDSCASPTWRFPSCSLKPSGPPPPPRLVRGCRGFTLLLAQEPQPQPQSVKDPSVECSPFAPSGVNSVFCWDPDGYTYWFLFLLLSMLY